MSPQESNFRCRKCMKGERFTAVYYHDIWKQMKDAGWCTIRLSHWPWLSFECKECTR